MTKWIVLPLAVAALLLVSCGDDEAGAEPTATVSARETPQLIDGVAVTTLQIGDEVSYPENVVLLVEAGCIECHCPCVNGLVQVSLDASGNVAVEDLFVPWSEEFPRRQSEDPKAPGGVRVDDPYI